MAEIKSSGTFEAPCQHDFELSCVLRAGKTPTDHTTVALLEEFKCLTCGAKLYAIDGKGKPTNGLRVPLVTTAPAVKPPPEQKAPPKSQADPAKGLCGTEMLSLTAELGIVSPPGCGCRGMAATMDRLGVEGCRERITDLRLTVASAWENWGWKDKLKAVTASAWKAAGLGVNPTDPVRDLLEISIERAEAKMQALNTTEAK